MSRVMHLSMTIEYALANALEDITLGGQLRLSPEEAKRQLLAKKAQGHRLIPMSDECVGFDPVSGCPGHEEEETP